MPLVDDRQRKATTNSITFRVTNVHLQFKFMYAYRLPLRITGLQERFWFFTHAHPVQLLLFVS